MKKKKILLVDDQENIRSDLKKELRIRKFTVYTAKSVKEAEEILKIKKIDFAIVDLKLDFESEYGGLKIVDFVKEHQPNAKTIILSAHSINDIKSQLAGKYIAFISKGGAKNYIIAVSAVLNKYSKVKSNGKKTNTSSR